MSTNTIQMKVKPNRTPQRKRYFSGLPIGLSWLLLCHFSLSAFCATYYLDAVNGNDGNKGTSAQPWKTLNRAYTWYSGNGSKVQEGDTVLFRNGNYGIFRESTDDGGGFLIYRSNWITYKADIGHSPIIDAIMIENNDKWGVSGDGHSYLIFDGFTITGVSIQYTSYVKILNSNLQQPIVAINGYWEPYLAGVCISSRASHYITIQGNEISRAYRGLATNTSDSNWIIKDNIFHHFGEDGFSAPTCNNLTIEGNYFYDHRPNSTAVTIYGTINGTFADGEILNMPTTDAQCIFIAGSQRASTIYVYFITGPNTPYTYWNANHSLIFVGSTSGASVSPITRVDRTHTDSFQIHGQAKNITIRNNIIDRGKYVSTGTEDGQGFKLAGNPTNILFENNLVIAGSNIITGTNNCDIINNTIWAEGMGELRVYNDSSSYDTIIDNFYNNICNRLNQSPDARGRYVWIKNHGNNIFRHVDTGGPVYPFSLDASEMVTTNFDNMFVNASYIGGNFQLKANSAAIDFGNPSKSPSTDILGVSRSIPPDAGCYEYVTGNPTYVINASASAGGSITPSGNVAVEQGQDQTFMITPDADYQIEDVLVDDVSQGAISSYTFNNVIANHTISATFSAVADTAPPTIVDVIVHSPVRVLFNELLDQASATNISNYSITPGITIISATLDTDQQTVILDTSDHQENTEYTLTVNGVKDLAGNAVVNATFTYLYSGGLIGHWKFDENSGTTANDSSGQENHGTLQGPIWDTHLYFDGVNDYVQVPHDNSLDLQTQLTLSAWVNLSDHDNDWPKIIVKPYQVNDDPWELYCLDLGHYGDTPRFIITDGNPGGSGATAVDNGYNLNINQWYHLVGTYDGSMMRLYVNGTSIATTNSNIQIGTNNMPLSIGGRLGTNSFNGFMRDVRIYNYALNAGEVTDLYNAGTSPSNLPPAADAGSDQNNIIDQDKNGSETVSLDGSGSTDPDGTIQSYVWMEGANQIATGPTPAVTLGVGIHTITLTVTDNEGAPDTDTVVVTVRQPPTANAGSDQPEVIDADWSGGENVTLNGSLSTDNDGTIENYVWNVGAVQIATGANPTVYLSVGDYTITLTVTDDDGLIDTDTVEVSVKLPIQYIINSIAVGQGGAIEPSGLIQIYQGNNQSFTITPNPGYSIADVLVDGTSQGAIASFAFDNVDEDHTISASFSPLSYTITASAPANGSISPSGSIQKAYGEDQTFTITPDDGYKIALVIVDGFSQGAISSYTFTDIDTDHTITAGFAPIVQSYTITAAAGSGGSISPGGSVQVTSGDDQAFTITPDEGYRISNVLVDGASQGAIATYTFSNVTEDHTISASFSALVQSYTITAAAGSGGGITPGGSVQVTSGGDQAFAITADEGYQISDVLVDGASQGAIATYTFSNVTEDHTISVSFTANTFTITASAAKGGAIDPTGEIQVQYGANQTFTITTESKYKIVHVRVDGSSVGTIDSYTFHNITEDHTISVSFARDPHNIRASATLGGRIELSGEVAVEDGADQTFYIYPDPGYHIANVVVDGESQGQISSYPFQNVTQDHTISVFFARTISDSDDQTPPKLTNCSPQADAIQAPLNTLIVLHVTDTETGVDPNSITIRVQDEVIYADGAVEYLSEAGHCRRVGTKTDYAFTYQPFDLFEIDQEVWVQIEAADYANNWLTNHNSYTFRTEMRTFGGNRTVDLDTRIPKDHPATALDSQGNIWVAWEAGLAGSRNVFVSKLRAGLTEFDPAVKITELTSDQCRPDLAIDHQDKICVVWQDKRRGNWDVYYRSSSDGVNWSTETPLVESEQDQANQTAPQIVIDSTNKATVVWEDNRNGNGDIYGVSSTNGFVSQNWFSVAINGSDQRAPSMVADTAGGVYIVWTDRRKGTADIYGASSLAGPWTNVGIVTGAGEQREPALAAEETGSILHLLWVNESNGNQDIYYGATSGGLNGTPLAGINLVDDSTGAAQSAPAIATLGTTGDELKVYACWEDNRNVSSSNDDRDIYFAEGAHSFGVNVLVTNDFSEADQIHPVIGVGADLEPYLIWVDFASGLAEIEYGGTTRISSEALAEKTITASQGGYVGADPDQIDGIDDVCVEIPAGALWSDLNITIHPIENPSALTSSNLTDIIARYEFGPSSSREFAKPVTITIPYPATGDASETVYWYNPKTGQLSQTGISGIELIVISETLHAVRFQTTHFTQYVVAVESSGEAGGGGSGGCSMSSYRQGPRGIVGFFLPYAVLIAVLWALKRRDRQRRERGSSTT